MRNELRDREPVVSPAQPLVQDDVASVGEAQASIDAMEKGLPAAAEVQGLTRNYSHQVRPNPSESLCRRAPTRPIVLVSSLAVTAWE
jgi:hypothetical protein